MRPCALEWATFLRGQKIRKKEETRSKRDNSWKSTWGLRRTLLGACASYIYGCWCMVCCDGSNSKIQGLKLARLGSVANFPLRLKGLAVTAIPAPAAPTFRRVNDCNMITRVSYRGISSLVSGVENANLLANRLVWVTTWPGDLVEKSSAYQLGGQRNKWTRIKRCNLRCTLIKTN